jgi:hypothetical protein
LAQFEKANCAVHIIGLGLNGTIKITIYNNILFGIIGAPITIFDGVKWFAKISFGIFHLIAWIVIF